MCRLVVVVVLVLLNTSTARLSSVPQCSGPPSTLQQILYNIAPDIKRVCLLSNVAFFANMNLSSSTSSIEATPVTSAACAYGSSIYVNQSRLSGNGSITIGTGGDAFEIVYASRGLYRIGAPAIAIAVGDRPPVEPLWLSYGVLSWQVCEVIDGELRLPSFEISTFDDDPGCLTTSTVLAGSVRAIKVVFNSSHATAYGNHTVVLTEGSCDATAASVSQAVTLIVHAPGVVQNVTTGTGVPTTSTIIALTPLIIVVPAAVVLFVGVLVIAVVWRILIIRRGKRHSLGQHQLQISAEHGEMSTLKTSVESNITVVVEKKDAPWIPMLTNELHTLHNCNCDVIEFKEVDLSCLQDQRCQCVYALIQRGDPTSDKLLDDFIDRLPPDVASKKLLSARFGVSEVDKSATGDESTTSRSISYTDQLDVEAAAKCAAMLHDAHPCCRVSRPPPLCIADLSDVLHDRSLSATPPGSATQLLEDSGCSSLTNSDQNTPNTQHRSQHHNFPKDQSSLLLTALVKAHHIGEQAKELKLNTRYLVDEMQTKTVTESTLP